MKYVIRVALDSKKFFVDNSYECECLTAEEEVLKDGEGCAIKFDSEWEAEDYLVKNFKAEYLPESLVRAAQIQQFIKNAYR